MTRFGRHEINPSSRADERCAVLCATQDPLLVLAADDPGAFVEALAEACLPGGGWAAYGAQRTVVNLLGPGRQEDGWYRLLDASIAFLRSNYVPRVRVPDYLLAHFVAGGGLLEDWLPFREPPDPNATLITPLADGELRCLIRGGDPVAAASTLVRQEGQLYVAVTALQWESGHGAGAAPHTVSAAWKRAHDLYELYLDIAWSTPMWTWAHPEIEPFFPAPPATI